MAKYVLVSDYTLMYDYRNFPLLDFLPCAPSSSVPSVVYNFLRGRASDALPNGEARYAPYSIRKIEAALLRTNRREDIVVPHPDWIESFIKDDTEIIAVSTMDPLGLGPLTLSYSVLLGTDGYAWVRRDFESLIARLNVARRGKKAKLMIGGPGVWEFMTLTGELNKLGIDYAYQGETDDIIQLLFNQIWEDKLDPNMFYQGFMSFDDNFRRLYKPDPRFVSRKPGIRNYPRLEEIPEIVRPTMKSMTETMRGCGVGCDFCEVTLRPLRYYPPEKIAKEIEVNVAGGHHNAWLHSDEIFAYEHEPLFRPNEDALINLFTAVMSVKGITECNPTHGRISIPAAYPELIGKLSNIIRAGPSNWIGLQVGIETGSERLAKIHMPNKTLPLRIGSDAAWQDIVWEGTGNMNRYYWRPAFTVQAGQDGETPEDNWDTVTLINRMSESEVQGRPYEFTVTPMQHVPLGVLKNNSFNDSLLDESQLAVYYASYRHLAKISARDAMRDSRGNPVVRIGTAGVIRFGGWLMLKVVESICRKRGLDLDKVKRYGLDGAKLHLN
jgi:radical SAM superfamily enzyme YgiQ (UPF0313 family)